jgi:hypothetical protein
MAEDNKNLTKEELAALDEVDVDDTDVLDEFADVDDVDDDADDDADQDVDDVQSIAKKMSELEIANKGLIKSLSAQRGIRQGLQEQLDEIKTAVATFKETKDLENELDDKKYSNIPIDFDEEGNLYLDTSKLMNLSTGDNAELLELKNQVDMLRNATTTMHTKASESEALNTLLSENEGYADAHKKVSSAWDYLKDDLFDDYLVKRGIAAPTTADQAIDIALNSKTINDAFTKKFPSLNMESVLEAHLIATPRYVRKALNLAITEANNTNELLDTDRPASLARANSSGGEVNETLLARVANMPTEEFMNLDARTMAKIDRLLEKTG